MNKFEKNKKIHVLGVLLFTILSAVFLYFGLTFSLERKLVYNEKGNVDYKVYLKGNDNFTEKYLGKGMKYIASLIDYIDIDYKYEFKSNQKMNYKCNYYILASSSVVNKNDKDKLIYKKEKYILNSQTKEFPDKDFVDLYENIKVNYDEYNNVIKDFINKYNISETENKLNLDLRISLEGQSDGFENIIFDKSLLNVSMPLTDQTVDIDINYKEVDGSGEKIDVSNSNLFNIIFFVSAGISFLIDLLILTFLISNYLKVKRTETAYEKEKNKLLYQYNRVISKVYNFVISLSYKIIDLKEFSDLLNIRDTLDRPILFTEFKERGVSCFMILDDDVLYRFTLKDKDL